MGLAYLDKPAREVTFAEGDASLDVVGRLAQDHAILRNDVLSGDEVSRSKAHASLVLDDLSQFDKAMPPEGGIKGKV